MNQKKSEINILLIGVILVAVVTVAGYAGTDFIESIYKVRTKSEVSL